MTVFSAEDKKTHTITVVGGKRGSCTREISGKITQEMVQKIAREEKISRFTVENSSGRELEGTDMPYNGNVRIKEYNAAKQHKVFSTEGNGGENRITITVVGGKRGSCTREVSGEVTQEMVQKIAREEKISRFTVETSAGRELEGTDMPYSGNVRIKEYNAAKDL